MPLFEFRCPEHHSQVVERYTTGNVHSTPPRCKLCERMMEQVEFSVPAKRDPEKGIQK